MKLVEFSIANLGSIRSLDFSDLGSKMVILGPNGTGKSFVIQGLELLFNELSWKPGDAPNSHIEYLWHKRQTDRHIVLEALLR